MTNPVILWRESFGYGTLIHDQTYISVFRSTNSPYGTVNAGIAGTFPQYGRGSGADEGFAMQGGWAGLRASTLGFSGAIDTNAMSNNSVGVAFAYNQAGRVGGCVLCEFWDDDGLGDSSFDRALLHLSVETLNDGRLVVKNGTGSANLGPGTIIGTSTFVLPVGLSGPAGASTHIEIKKPVIHATNGSVKVYANGVLVLDLSGVATRNSLGGSGKIGYVQPIARTSAQIAGGPILSDLIVHDCSGAGIIGDKRVGYFPALVAGTYTAGTATGAGSRLLCVNEQAADGDTTYILEDNTALPKKVSFTCKAMPANTVSIDEVTEHIIHRKTDASANTSRYGMKSGATEVDNGVDLATPSGYGLMTLAGPAPGHAVDPHTSAAWSVVNCDAAEIIYQRVA